MGGADRGCLKDIRKKGVFLVTLKVEFAGQLRPGEVPKGEQVKPVNDIWDFGILGPELE